MKNDIIRFENNVPDNYLVGSRDYQALLRLFTFGISSIKFDVDNIRYVNDASHINSRLLNLLKLKVGFFTKEEFKDQYIREVLKVFSLIVKKKGTRQAIYDAINLYFRACRYNGDYVVEINNKDAIQPYMIRIGVTKESNDILLLEEILKYILPTGYLYEVFKYSTAKYKSNYYSQDILTLSVVDDYNGSNIHDNSSNVFIEKAPGSIEKSITYYNVYNNVTDDYINILTYPSVDDIELYNGDFTISISEADFDLDNANMYVLIHQYLKDDRIVCSNTTWSITYNAQTDSVTATSGNNEINISYSNFIRNLPLLEDHEIPSSFTLEYENESISTEGFVLQDDNRSFTFIGYSGNKIIVKYETDSQYLGKRIDNIVVYKNGWENESD